MVAWEKEKLDPVQVGRARNGTETHTVLSMAGEEAPLQVCITTTVLNPLPHHALSHARSCAGSFPHEADSYEVFVAILRMSGLISSFQFYFNSLCRIHYTHLAEPWLSPVHHFSSSQKPAILFSPQLISKRPRA